MSNVWFDLTWIRRYFVTLSPLKLENSNSCKFWWSLQVTKIRFKSKRKRKLEKLREIHLPNNLFRWKQITYLSLFSNYSFCVLLKNVLFKCSKIKKKIWSTKCFVQFLNVVIKVGTAIYSTIAMIVAVILILIGVFYMGYCIWNFVRSKYRPLKEENEDSKSKEES